MAEFVAAQKETVPSVRLQFFVTAAAISALIWVGLIESALALYGRIGVGQ
jgi:hypothetical protein